METGCKWEKSTIVNELIQGMEVARQLKFHLSSSSSSSETQQRLLQRILSSYDTALLLLNWSESSTVQTQTMPAMVTVLPESPISTTESPRIEGFKDHHRDVSKKRKALPTWKEQVKICSDNGVGSSADDGYSWRKYGQKDILGAKYPRSYYRCTYRNTQTCYARKQVQKSDNDPTIFEITYKGKHTCLQASNSVPPVTPEKQELKYDNHYQQQQPNDVMINFRANLRVKTEDLRKMEASDSFSFPSGIEYLTNDSQLSSFSQLVNENLMGTFSPSFISPATTGSSNFSVSPYQINSFGQFSDSDHTEIISANTSTTNSPILDLDFQINEVDLDPNFPFDTPGFF